MQNEDQQTSEEAVAEAYSEPGNSASFVFKLALAITRANPSKCGADEQTRANEALKFLLGDSYRKLPGEIETRAALRWMAQEYVRDRRGWAISLGKDPFAHMKKDPPDAKTQISLAEAARVRFAPHLTAKYLADEFSRKKEGLYKAEIAGSDIPDSLDLQALTQIQAIVRPLGLKMHLDD